jgi:hypothetical protein
VRQCVQKFHPVAAPSAGSTNFVACRTNPPVLGMKAVISPAAYATPAVTRPMARYARKAPAGPAMEMTCPELRKRPVPWKGALLENALRIENVAWCPEVAYDHPGNGDHVDVAGLEVALICSTCPCWAWAVYISTSASAFVSV